ncbi:hypothetical protein OT109_03070 [Phycisphaeraceae bacterium D3-23]
MAQTSLLLGAAMALALAGPVSAGNPAGGNGRFLSPTRVQSQSGVINLRVAMDGVPRSGRGHAGPHVADFDADGTPDLLVGDIFGNIFFYKGLGTDSAAPYADAEPVRMADGELLVFKNW